MQLENMMEKVAQFAPQVLLIPMEEHHLADSSELAPLELIFVDNVSYFTISSGRKKENVLKKTMEN